VVSPKKLEIERKPVVMFELDLIEDALPPINNKLQKAIDHIIKYQNHNPPNRRTRIRSPRPSIEPTLEDPIGSPKSKRKLTRKDKPKKIDYEEEDNIVVKRSPPKSGSKQ